MMGTDAKQFHDIGWKVTVDCEGGTAYFPEKYLAEWFAENWQEDITIWTFETTGVKPLKEAYQHVVTALGIEAIVLVVL